MSMYSKSKGYKKMYMTDHSLIIGFCTCKSIWLLTEFYVVINKTDKTLITVSGSFNLCQHFKIYIYIKVRKIVGIGWIG
jgi:hypothetical protein